MAPLVFLVHTLIQLRKTLEQAVVPLKQILPGANFSLGGLSSLGFVTLILLLLISWLCGWLIVRTALGRSIKSWLEDTILQRTPIFQTYQKVTGQTAPAASKSASPVLVLVNGDWQPAVVTETAANGWSTVFVPDIPLIKSGRLYCFPGEQVRKLNCSLTDFKKQLAVVGRGSQDWLEKVTESKN